MENLFSTLPKEFKVRREVRFSALGSQKRKIIFLVFSGVPLVDVNHSGQCPEGVRSTRLSKIHHHQQLPTTNYKKKCRRNNINQNQINISFEKTKSSAKIMLNNADTVLNDKFFIS